MDLAEGSIARVEGHLQVQRTSSLPKLVVTADGRGVVGHAGCRLLADLAEATGLSPALSEALAPLRRRDRGHVPGRVAVDLAVMLADGGEAIADLAVLRNQSDLFGSVASDATAWRVLDGIDDAALALKGASSGFGCRSRLRVSGATSRAAGGSLCLGAPVTLARRTWPRSPTSGMGALGVVTGSQAGLPIVTSVRSCNRFKTSKV